MKLFDKVDPVKEKFIWLKEVDGYYGAIEDEEDEEKV